MLEYKMWKEIRKWHLVMLVQLLLFLHGVELQQQQPKPKLQQQKQNEPERKPQVYWATSIDNSRRFQQANEWDVVVQPNYVDRQWPARAQNPSPALKPNPATPTTIPTPPAPVYGATPSPYQAYMPPAPPAYHEPAPLAYHEPAPPAYHEPAPPAYHEPAPPAYHKPAPPAYHEPAPPAYHEPAPPAYHEPAPPAYHEPAPPAYHESAPPAYHEPAPPAYPEPAPPAYPEPAPPAYPEPAPPAYPEPAPPAYHEPAPPAYHEPAPQAYHAPALQAYPEPAAPMYHERAPPVYNPATAAPSSYGPPPGPPEQYYYYAPVEESKEKRPSIKYMLEKDKEALVALFPQSNKHLSNEQKVWLSVLTPLIVVALVVPLTAILFSGFTITTNGRKFGELNLTDMKNSVLDIAESYRSVLDKDECMQRIICDLGSYAKSIPGKSYVLTFLSTLVPDTMKNNMAIFQKAATYDAERAHCNNFKCSVWKY